MIRNQRVRKILVEEANTDQDLYHRILRAGQESQTTGQDKETEIKEERPEKKKILKKIQIIGKIEMIESETTGRDQSQMD